ncbi:GNAT family N-acetyltransferase [Klebsiella quasivariicola]|uniref:GNAT family N-acetyltransferase n=1 Tax=Klebsiella quasivariicola TaxID=2026240 RepID=UPI002B053D54|nr:GNAT family N-acetyltransferase [Klebsiella quasivariicola]
MTDPHNALVSFQSALQLGLFQPSTCKIHKELAFWYDIPNDSPRFTYALLDKNNVVKAMALLVLAEPCDDGPCFNVGYAVAESFRGQGLAYEILEKSLEEFIALSKGQAPCSGLIIPDIILGGTVATMT